MVDADKNSIEENSIEENSIDKNRIEESMREERKGKGEDFDIDAIFGDENV